MKISNVIPHNQSYLVFQILNADTIKMEDVYKIKIHFAGSSITTTSEQAHRDGNLWVVVIVKSWVNKQAGSWLVIQEHEKRISSQVSLLTQLLTMITTHKFPLQDHGTTEAGWAGCCCRQLTEHLHIEDQTLCPLLKYIILINKTIIQMLRP